MPEQPNSRTIVLVTLGGVYVAEEDQGDWYGGKICATRAFGSFVSPRKHLPQLAHEPAIVTTRDVRENNEYYREKTPYASIAPLAHFLGARARFQGRDRGDSATLSLVVGAARGARRASLRARRWVRPYSRD